ncbi:SDR family oxidoreductase [Pseudonocardia aurantiaca]|uniref:SDR family oxidoreductase n=1 Tax=Pseudonocardia aurantiaca TaxID=75290 RepID=A0ABW4FQC8_9PSEU
MPLDSASSAVLVTGASRGIGLATARLLAQHGHRVFAGVRKPDSIAALVEEFPGAVVPLTVDLNEPATYRAAAGEIAEQVGAAGLAGLVNNAGYAVPAPLEFLPLEELRAQMEVNLVGQLGVTQAVLPLLRAARGRIVNVSSIGGLVAGPMLGAYHVSKFGLEAMSDSLRRELRHLGVDVVVVEPGAVRTDIWATGRNHADALLAVLPSQVTELYGHLVDRVRAEATGASERGVAPEVAAATIVRALTRRRPRARYLVGREARVARVVSRFPARFVDRLVAAAPDPARAAV